MHRPTFFSILGCLAIAIASAGYGVYLLDSTLTAVAVTALVIVSILLGMTQIVMGYEIQNPQRVNQDTDTASSQLDSLRLMPKPEVPPRPLLGVGQSKISRPSSFPPTAYRSTISVRNTGEEETGRYLDEWTPPDPAKVLESERRLEQLRQALARSGREGGRAPSEVEKGVGRVRSPMPRERVRYDPQETFEPKQFLVSLVGRNEVVLTSVRSGEEVRYPCDNAVALETAWRAFARGVKVKPTIISGRVVQLDID